MNQGPKSNWLVIGSVVLLIVLLLLGFRVSNISLDLGPISVEMKKATDVSFPSDVIIPFQGGASTEPASMGKSDSAPVFDYIEQYENYSGGQLIISEDVYFSDSDGDAYLIKYDLVSVSPAISGIQVQNDSISIAPDQQKFGTYQTILWKCGLTKKTYTVTLRARILDQAGHESSPFDVIFKCH
jgi:hypothetical protein